MLTSNNFNNLFAAAQAATVQSVTGTASGKYSVSVVNSNGNGKRITLSKALVEKLELDGSVSFIPLKEERVILMAKELPFPSASTIELTSGDKRIAYNADAVKLLVDEFDLDYSGGRTSMSFNHIDFNVHDGITIATIEIPAAASANLTSADAV